MLQKNKTWSKLQGPDKMHIFISILPISSPNPMFDHLVESSRRDDSNKWSNIEFGEKIGILEIEIRTLSGALGSHSWHLNNERKNTHKNQPINTNPLLSPLY